ncbi:MAG: S49 family peptidase, partial [Myxococcota bacterium]
MCNLGYVAAQNRVPLGLRWPMGSAADSDAALSLRFQPAEMGFQKSWSLSLLHVDRLRFFEGDAGDGEGVFFSAKLLSFLALGVGIQYQWSWLEKNTRFADFARFSWSGSVRLVSWLGVGFTVHHYLGGSAALSILTGLDVGVLVRSTAWLSLGGVIRDVNAPFLEDTALSRVYALGVALRPLSNDRWTLRTDVCVSEDGLRVPWTLRWQMMVRWPDGLRWGVYGRHQFREGRFALGGLLELRLGMAGVGMLVGGVLSSRDSTQNRFAQAGMHIWLSGAKSRALQARLPQVPRLDIFGALPERDLGFSLGAEAGAPAFLHLILRLRRLERDPRVRGVLIRLGALQCGFAKVQELRNMFARLRKKGKRVWVYMVSANVKAYALAVGADRIFLHPAGSLFVGGFARIYLFFKGVFQHLGIRPQFVKIGKYKTAPHRYTHDDLTPSHRQADKAILEQT